MTPTATTTAASSTVSISTTGTGSSSSGNGGGSIDDRKQQCNMVASDNSSGSGGESGGVSGGTGANAATTTTRILCKELLELYGLLSFLPRSDRDKATANHQFYATWWLFKNAFTSADFTPEQAKYRAQRQAGGGGEGTHHYGHDHHHHYHHGHHHHHHQQQQQQHPHTHHTGTGTCEESENNNLMMTTTNQLPSSPPPPPPLLLPPPPPPPPPPSSSSTTTTATLSPASPPPPPLPPRLQQPPYSPHPHHPHHHYYYHHHSQYQMIEHKLKANQTIQASGNNDDGGDDDGDGNDDNVEEETDYVMVDSGGGGGQEQEQQQNQHVDLMDSIDKNIDELMIIKNKRFDMVKVNDNGDEDYADDNHPSVTGVIIGGDDDDDNDEQHQDEEEEDITVLVPDDRTNRITQLEKLELMLHIGYERLLQLIDDVNDRKQVDKAVAKLIHSLAGGYQVFVENCRQFDQYERDMIENFLVNNHAAAATAAVDADVDVDVDDDLEIEHQTSNDNQILKRDKKRAKRKTKQQQPHSQSSSLSSSLSSSSSSSSSSTSAEQPLPPPPESDYDTLTALLAELELSSLDSFLSFPQLEDEEELLINVIKKRLDSWQPVDPCAVVMSHTFQQQAPESAFDTFGTFLQPFNEPLLCQLEDTVNRFVEDVEKEELYNDCLMMERTLEMSGRSGTGDDGDDDDEGDNRKDINGGIPSKMRHPNQKDRDRVALAARLAKQVAQTFFTIYHQAIGPSYIDDNDEDGDEDGGGGDGNEDGVGCKSLTTTTTTAVSSSTTTTTSASTVVATATATATTTTTTTTAITDPPLAYAKVVAKKLEEKLAKFEEYADYVIRNCEEELPEQVRNGMLKWNLPPPTDDVLPLEVIYQHYDYNHYEHDAIQVFNAKNQPLRLPLKEVRKKMKKLRAKRAANKPPTMSAITLTDEQHRQMYDYFVALKSFRTAEDPLLLPKELYEAMQQWNHLQSEQDKLLDSDETLTEEEKNEQKKQLQVPIRFPPEWYHAGYKALAAIKSLKAMLRGQLEAPKPLKMQMIRCAVRFPLRTWPTFTSYPLPPPPMLAPDTFVLPARLAAVVGKRKQQQSGIIETATTLPSSSTLYPPLPPQRQSKVATIIKRDDSTMAAIAAAAAAASITNGGGGGSVIDQLEKVDDEEEEENDEEDDDEEDDDDDDEEDDEGDDDDNDDDEEEDNDNDNDGDNYYSDASDVADDDSYDDHDHDDGGVDGVMMVDGGGADNNADDNNNEEEEDDDDDDVILYDPTDPEYVPVIQCNGKPVCAYSLLTYGELARRASRITPVANAPSGFMKTMGTSALRRKFRQHSAKTRHLP